MDFVRFGRGCDPADDLDVVEVAMEKNDEGRKKNDEWDAGQLPFWVQMLLALIALGLGAWLGWVLL